MFVYDKPISNFPNYIIPIIVIEMKCMLNDKNLGGRADLAAPGVFGLNFGKFMKNFFS